MSGRPDFSRPNMSPDGVGGGGENRAAFVQGVKLGPVDIGLRTNTRYPQARAQEAARVAVEAGSRPYEFSMTLGSLTEADTDAIAVPSNPWFGLGGGGVENALVRDIDKVAGNEAYSEQGAGTQFFKGTEAYARAHASRTLPAVGMARESRGLPFGTAVAFPNAQMATRGIDNVVLVNTLPVAAEGENLNAQSVSLAVRNAMLAAEQAGATSLAISEIGTGFLAAMGGSPFQTREEAWLPMLSGLLQYAEMVQRGEAKGTVTKLSLAVYAGASESNAAQVGEMLKSVIATAKTGLQVEGRQGK